MEKRAAFSPAITCFNILVIALLLLSVHAQDYPPCETMDRQPGTNGASWAHGATVTVIINPTDFPTVTERGKIEDAFRAWENANTNSGVHFEFTTGSSRPTGEAACYWDLDCCSYKCGEQQAHVFLANQILRSLGKAV
jgi:hypothetical protein